MIHKLLIASILCCGVALAQPSQGGPGHGGPGFGDGHGFGQHPGGEMHPLLPPGRWWKDANVVKTVGINDGQVQKIEQVFQDSRVKLVDIHASLQKEEIKLEPLLEADNPDEAAVLSSIDRIAASRATLEKANAQMAFAIRRVLTPEQWKKLRSLRPKDHFPPPADGPHGRMMMHDDHMQHEDHMQREEHHPAPPPAAGEQAAPPAAPDAGQDK